MASVTVIVTALDTVKLDSNVDHTTVSKDPHLLLYPMTIAVMIQTMSVDRLVSFRFNPVDSVQLLYFLIILMYMKLALIPSVHVWMGLNNPNSVSCTDTLCTGKLKWEDDSDFTYQEFYGSFLVQIIFHLCHAI